MTDIIIDILKVCLFFYELSSLLLCIWHYQVDIFFAFAISATSIPESEWCCNIWIIDLPLYSSKLKTIENHENHRIQLWTCCPSLLLKLYYSGTQFHKWSHTVIKPGNHLEGFYFQLVMSHLLAFTVNALVSSPMHVSYRRWSALLELRC